MEPKRKAIFKDIPRYQIALLVIVLMAGALVAGIWIISPPGVDDQKYQPVATVTSTWTSDGNITVNISHISSRIRLSEFKFIILDLNRIPVEEGGLYDKVNGTYRSQNLIFHDNDLDKRLSINDTLTLVSVDNGGIVEQGYILRIWRIDASPSTMAAVEIQAKK